METTLICWVHGDPSLAPFPIDIDWNKTIGHLKMAIVTVNPNCFNSIDAPQLELCVANIPDTEKAMNEFVFKDDNKLRGSAKIQHIIKDHFQGSLPDLTIHFAIKRPAPPPLTFDERNELLLFRAGVANKPPPSSTATTLKSIQRAEVKDHLTRIIDIEYDIHSADQSLVEKHQKNRFGDFFKNPLPHGLKENDINLPMLGKLLDVEPTTSTNETVSAIIQGDIGKQSGFYTIALIGRSGAGKTATIVSAARQHFVVYFVCSRKGDPQLSGIIDRSFNILAGEVAEYPDRSPNLTTFDEIRSNNEHLKMRVVDRVKVELLARLLFLCMLFKKNQNLTPEEYFREQINGASEAIHAIVLQLKLYCIDSIDLLLTTVRQELRKKIDDSRGLVVAVDEAQIAEKFILSGRFIAPSKELLPDSQLFNSKGRVHKEYTRGFFTPLCATLSIYTTLVVLGTSLSLSHTDRLESAISKQSYLQVIHNFPSASESQVVGLLKRSLNLEDCDIDASKRQKLSGRLRFSASIITHFNQSDLSDCKQKRLDRAVDKAIMSAKADLRATIEDMLTDGNAKKLLSRMVLAYKLGDGKIGFAHQFDVDYVIGNLCALTRHSDEYNWVIDEPLVIEVAEEVLMDNKINASYLTYNSFLNDAISNFGKKTAVKGNAIEPLVRECLKEFNGRKLSELPFLGISPSQLPKWCSGIKLQIGDIGDANHFGFEGGLEADLEFMRQRPHNKLLVPQSKTRPDGLWFFNENYAGSLAIKFYSASVHKDVYTDNNTSSDVRQSFLDRNGKDANARIIREKWESYLSVKPIKGMIRVHIVLPGAQGHYPLCSYVENNKDVMIYIHSGNMDQLFDQRLSDLVKYIIG